MTMQIFSLFVINDGNNTSDFCKTAFGRLQAGSPEVVTSTLYLPVAHHECSYEVRYGLSPSLW